VLRIPNTSLFTAGDATLKPEGQALLNQIAQSLADTSDSFELRIESYTDTDAESADTTAGKSGKPHFASSWDLTAARATAIERYYRDQTSLTFQNVLVSARGDSQPIAPKDPVHNRRVEISLAPLPAAFHPDTSSTTEAAPAKDKTKDKTDKTEKGSDKNTDKAATKGTDKSEKTSEKNSDKPSAKSDKTSEKSTDKSAAKTTDKPKNTAQ